MRKLREDLNLKKKVPCTYPIKAATTPQSLKSSAASYTSHLWIYQPGNKKISIRTLYMTCHFQIGHI